MADSRFNEFTEQERSIIAFGLTLLTMEMFIGIVGGPMPAEVQARDLPVIVRLMNSIGTTLDVDRIDPDIVAQAVAILDQLAAAETDEAAS